MDSGAQRNGLERKMKEQKELSRKGSLIPHGAEARTAAAVIPSGTGGSNN